MRPWVPNLYNFTEDLHASYRNPSADLNLLQVYTILRNVSIRNLIVIERGAKLKENIRAH